MDEDELWRIRPFEKETGHHIIKKLGSGEFGGVFAFIPKDDAQGIISTLQASTEPGRFRTAIDTLLTKIQAAKIDPGMRGYRKEIQNLQALKAGGYQNIAQIKGTADARFRWLFLEAFSGRSMAGWIHYNSHRPQGNLIPPVGLAWHMMSQLCQSFLELHFGLKVPQRDVTGRFAHKDIKADNMMLRPSGAYEDYPDLVLIDLGIATRVKKDTEYPSFRTNPDGTFVLNAQGERIWLPSNDRDSHSQVKDLNDAGDVLMEAFRDLPRDIGDNLEVLQTIQEEMRSFSSKILEEPDRTLYRHLMNLRDRASRRRDDLHQPLPDDIKTSIRAGTQIVSDDDLKSAFPELDPRYGRAIEEISTLRANAAASEAASDANTTRLAAIRDSLEHGLNIADAPLEDFGPQDVDTASRRGCDAEEHDVIGETY